MQRISIFFFLTLLLPAGIYWASHGFESPGRGLNRFVEEVHALAGDVSGPEPEPEPIKYRAPKPKPKESEEPKPNIEESSEPKISRIEQAQNLFDAGKFAQAATIFAEMDGHMHALSLLGAALARAFPCNLPDGPYYVVTTSKGVDFEGFASERSDLLTLTSPGGRTLSLPANVITATRKLDRPKAIERLARNITAEGTSRMLKGPRLFALLAETFSMDRPDVAAPLLERVLELDEVKPFFLSSVRQRAPPEYYDELYLALGRCAVVEDDGPAQETVSTHAPKKLGNGAVVRKPRKSRTSIRSKEAIALVRKAAPHRTEGAKLHKQTVRGGLASASTQTIDKAVREFEKAMGYYEDALKHEDNDEIHALLRFCSRRAFQLRFWREQVAGR